MQRAVPVRYFKRLLLTAGLVLLSVQHVTAQQSVEMPESVVLVLKLVSSTYVRPTTGVVISDDGPTDGLVLIPADFVAAGDEIVVLDGGTDIVRNGRPSRTVKRSVADGLAVLSVEDLARPSIILSEDVLQLDRVYHMAAFPPAAELAEGAQPLRVPVKLVKHDSNGGFTVSADTPLPNTTGAIIDRCGYLVGLNMAAGAQSLDKDKNPVSILGEELASILKSMQISLQSRVCGDTPEQAEPVDQPEQTSEPGSIPPVVTPQPAEKSPPVSDKGAASITKRAVTSNTSPSVLAIIPMWVWFLGGALGVVILAKLSYFLHLTRHAPQPADGQQAAPGSLSASEEPATAPLDPGSDSAHRHSGFESSGAHEMPDINALPDGFDGIVVIDGSLGEGTGFKRYCVVDTKQFAVVIGRSDSNADIAIETPAISRKHARLAGDGESLTLSDLGSSNGTFIRGIPCLPSEIMFISHDDEILLGDIRLRISVLTKPGEPG